MRACGEWLRVNMRAGCLLQAIVEAALGQVDEVGAGDGHLIQENGALDGAHGGVKSGDRVWHLGFVVEAVIGNVEDVKALGVWGEKHKQDTQSASRVF